MVDENLNTQIKPETLTEKGLQVFIITNILYLFC